MKISDLYEALYIKSKYSVFDELKNYPTSFVHFSKDIGKKSTQRAPYGNKFGINPLSTHSDPRGIYFYYNSWLLNTKVIISDDQYAVDYSNYWICDINDNNSINLGTITFPQVKKFVKNNGWLQEFNDVLPAALAYKSRYQAIYPKNKAGGKLWAVMDYLVNERNEFTWSLLLKGVDVVFDPGLGIINYGEPYQVIVLNKKAITVLKHGTNKNIEDKNIANIMKDVADMYFGTFKYKNTYPIIQLRLNDIPITVRYEHNSFYIGTFVNGIWIEVKERISDITGNTISQFKKLLIDTIKSYTNDQEPDGFPGRGKTGIKNKWTEHRINNLIRYITYRSDKIIHRYVSDGKLVFSTGWQGYKFQQKFDFIIDNNDNMTADITFTDNLTIRINSLKKFTFDQSNKEIASMILNDIKKQLSDLISSNRIDIAFKIIGLRLPSNQFG